MNAAAAPVDFSSLAQTEHTVRVAIYDEANISVPVGPNPILNNSFTNNLNEIQTLLEDAGHTVTLLDEQDILNHQLLTADFDVFVLVNNVPRETIANYVYEFWLGGGGLLTFNLAFTYLNYQNIIWPDLNLDGYGILWANISADVMNVTMRHPTMTEHHISDTISERASDWATIAESTFDGSPVWNSITPLLKNITQPNYIYGFAMNDDNVYRGGRLVHLPGDGSSIPAAFESIILDSVEWLVPRPIGRILYDLTHQPRLAVDPWDIEYATLYTSRHFGDLRSLAVNHSYTFDKLYPSTAGNITAARLASYDVLIISWPDKNYTSSEGAIIEAWVEGGGSVLVLGDRTGLGPPNGYGDTNLNMILQNFDMSLGTTDVLDFDSMTPATHVTLEGCSSLNIGYRNYLNVLGNATEIWMDGSNCVVAGQEFGAGRAILSSDMNIFDAEQLGLESNTQFALNVLNWLSAGDADILVHSDFLGQSDPVCKALRDLGLSYQFFYTRQYLDDFLDSKSWELLIYNNVYQYPETTIYDALYAFVDNGGSMILTYFGVDDSPTHPLWSKLGVEYDTTLTGTPSMYFWDSSHPIFTEPNDHTMYNYTSNGPFADDGDTVVYFEGYTALAGTTATVQNGTATIVVSDDRTTLFNTIIIDNFGTDEDDSTYADSIELWQNEIVFMMTEPTTPPPGGFPIDTTTLLIIGAGVLAVIVIGAIVCRKRGSSAATKPRKRTTKKKK
jgi:hypothetical protein